MKKKLLLPLLAFALITTVACSLFSGDSPSSIPLEQAPAGDAPSAPSVDNNILFKDDFSDTNSGWDRNSWDTGLTDYGDGVYQMQVNESTYDIWANPGKYFEGDVRVEADATKVGGDDDNDYGLICRYAGSPDSPNYYFFIISSDGYSVIGKASAASTEYLSSEKMIPTDAIKQGATTNHLRADCIGNTLTFYVNGQQVATTTDSSFTGGDIGFMAGTFDVPSTEIAFDNLVVSKP